MALFLSVGSGDIRENVISLHVGGPAVDPLRPYVAYEAMHDSGEVDAQGDCHPGTRIEVQDIIKRWAGDRQPDSLVNLMIGAAGAGKSTIMRTIAKALEEEGKLLGSFFCFRSSKRRNNGSLVIATLAAQIVQRIPHLRPLVYQALQDEQGLLTKAMDIQAMKLIIEPLNSLDLIDRPQWPYVVLLDGLDEINGVAAQQAIIKVFAYINRHLFSPLHFLLASRPEPPILQAFDEFMGGRWTELELDESFRPNNDIDIFYVDHFQKICDRNPDLPPGWPGVPVRRILLTKGSGQFIFASVIIGVVGDATSTLSPEERLNLVMEVTKQDDLRPLERLDLLYVTVLNQIPETARLQVLRILSVILAAGNVMYNLLPTPRFLDALFCVPPGTTRHRLSNLHSVLKLPRGDSNTISPQHATLGDFIFDKARSELFGFHVDKSHLVGETFVQIATSLQSNPDQMADAFSDFIRFFDTQMENERLGRGSLPRELIQKLQSYPPSSLSPLALILFVAPLASIIKTSRKYQSFRNLSRSIIQEAHRRARLYCNNYGISGVTLLAVSMMILDSTRVRRKYHSLQWDVICPLWTGEEKSTILSMDRTSGLGLTYVKIDMGSTSKWARTWDRNRWLRSYLHLIARLDIVADVARLQRLQRTSERAGLRDYTCVWGNALSFDQPTVSALRATVSSAQRKRNSEDFNALLYYIKHYIEKHWRLRWRIPSLFLLRRDWNRWVEGLTRAPWTVPTPNLGV